MIPAAVPVSTECTVRLCNLASDLLLVAFNPGGGYAYFPTWEEL